MTVKISKKWKRMAEIYRRFAPDSYYDFSEEAAMDMYCKETYGTLMPVREKHNGYFYGKQWMDLTITEYWLPDLADPETVLYSWELYLDFPKWFIDKVIPEKYHLTEEEIEKIRERIR